jgi:hypothetical protein
LIGEQSRFVIKGNFALLFFPQGGIDFYWISYTLGYVHGLKEHRGKTSTKKRKNKGFLK